VVVPAAAKNARVALADLPASAETDSVQVKCKSAEVQRVEVIRSTATLSRQATAKDLLDKLERHTDALEDLQGERQTLETELAFLRGLSLRTTRPKGVPPAAEGLFAEAWKRILVWMEGRSSRLSARLAALAKKRKTTLEKIHALQVEARDLDIDKVNRVVSRVVTTLRGRPGVHHVVLSYRVGEVRWVPSYDLRYEPRRHVVEAAYYAVVNQSTGEDWTDARLRFSTAMPTQLLAIPELPTWTLGRRRDFIPTPRPRLEPAAARWRPPEPSPKLDPVVAHLRQLLHRATAKPAAADTTVDTPTAGAAESRLGEQLATGRTRVAIQPDSDADAIVDAEDKDAFEDEDGLPDRPPPAKEKLAKLERRVEVLREQSYRHKARLQLSQASVLAGAPAASRSGWGGEPEPPQETVPWTDEGYRPPDMHRDLPAAGAEGYRFTLYAPGRHTVAANGVRRRIPLLRRELRVRPVHRILPGVSKAAYLVGTVTNTTGRPILRGHANLFAGTMFAGRSWLNTALPGKTIRLPLGVDDTVKVERHLRQRTVTEGVLFKDDVTEYTVEIEIANHRDRAIQVELKDQLPKPEGRKIEVRAFSARPKMQGPDRIGRVIWRGSVDASSVKKLRFKFQIVRPKDWELSQHDA
jgi:hypothetical protein